MEEIIPRLHEEIAKLRLVNEQHREDNAKLREVVRRQGQFIDHIKRDIRDFRDQSHVSLGIPEPGFRAGR